ncbi:SubName: Full=Uncharacterized protein {ECO:0000313/EMBL:CCA73662.1} [Serendipita indica DSM 11827]|uniref:Uncharacterized protein n=1 Tax=Serendipita indica (strain DSM 11827) TaxID=1109443 RepID=G4TQR9_SERID|nr:SubName: Full=Uncharacterized protein {ECO:0000313/EMBL:CCA73662.1} [Serendipita indica DSM 11827]CCA73662.1 hypothetical protein PIIN_07615 [Serendipita indica DSM 11827]
MFPMKWLSQGSSATNHPSKSPYGHAVLTHETPQVHAHHSTTNHLQKSHHHSGDTHYPLPRDHSISPSSPSRPLPSQQTHSPNLLQKPRKPIEAHIHDSPRPAYLQESDYSASQSSLGLDFSASCSPYRHISDKKYRLIPSSPRGAGSATWLTTPLNVPYGTDIPLVTTPIPPNLLRTRSPSTGSLQSPAKAASRLHATHATPSPTGHRHRLRSNSTPHVNFSPFIAPVVIHTPPTTPPYLTPKVAVLDELPDEQQRQEQHQGSDLYCFPSKELDMTRIPVPTEGRTYIVGSYPTNSPLSEHRRLTAIPNPVRGRTVSHPPLNSPRYYIPLPPTPPNRHHSLHKQGWQWSTAQAATHARPPGYFNRRGDEFLGRGMVRRQPHARMEWHSMFGDCPDPGHGWMNEHGHWIPEGGGILKHGY